MSSREPLCLCLCDLQCPLYGGRLAGPPRLPVTVQVSPLKIRIPGNPLVLDEPLTRGGVACPDGRERTLSPEGGLHGVARRQSCPPPPPSLSLSPWRPCPSRGPSADTFGLSLVSMPAVCQALVEPWGFALLHCTPPPTLLTTSQVRAGALADIPLVSAHCPSTTGRLAATEAATISSVHGRTSRRLAPVPIPTGAPRSLADAGAAENSQPSFIPSTEEQGLEQSWCSCCGHRSLLRSVHTSGWQLGVWVGIRVFEPQCAEVS